MINRLKIFAGLGAFVLLLGYCCRAQDIDTPTPVPTQERQTPIFATATTAATKTATAVSAPTLPAFVVNAKTCIPSTQAEQGKVTQIVDGDTIRVLIEGVVYPVRYIGIDAPEDTKSVEFFGAEATRRNRELVSKKEVSLYKDVSNTDKYGRLLRYVVTEDNIFVNLRLVEEGYAYAVTYPPDVACADAFRTAQAFAIENGLGLWGNPPVSMPVPTYTVNASSDDKHIPPSGNNCDPAYPTVCIPPPPPDLDCADISYRRFTVLSPDPHNFDGDGDGIGCERK